MRKVLASLVFMFFACAAAAAPLRIAALGDSLVQGYGLAPDQGLVPQLESWLRDQGVEVQLINAGVSGDTTAGGAARIDWTLAENPDGLIVLLGGNDLLRGIDPAETKANLARILAAAQVKKIDVLLIGVQALGNYGPAYKASFDVLYGELAEEYGVMLFDNAFSGIAAKTAGDPIALQKFMQGDGIHPNAEGVTLNVRALGPATLDLITQMQD